MSGQPPANDERYEEARRGFDEAERMFEAGNHAGALAEFQRVYQLLEGHPRRFFVLYNIGRCQELLSHYAEALDSYQRYVAEGGAGPDSDPQLADSVREKIRNLTEQLAPRPSAAEPEPPPVAAPTEQPMASSTEQVSSGGQVSVPAILLLTAGGVLAVGAGVTGGISHGMHEDLAARCPSMTCDASAQSDVEIGNALALTSTVMTFASIASVAVGAIVLAIDLTSGHSDQLALEVVAGPRESGLRIQGRF